jgi:hypothetical protein
MPIDYQGRRNRLLLDIGLGMCAHCGSIEKLTVHHCDGNGLSHGIGGRQQLYKLEKEFRDGVEMKVLCDECHQEEHKQLVEDERK